MAYSWQTSASLPLLRMRAELLAHIREFFNDNTALEVETPIVETSATTDPHIQSLQSGKRFLRTSPELAMKRLLAAIGTDIYQIGKVFRADEVGRLHNPEFTMLEWYRTGYDYRRLMDETDSLLRHLCEPYQSLTASERITCETLFRDTFAVDIHADGCAGQLIAQAQDRGLRDCTGADVAFDFLLNTALRENPMTAIAADRLLFIYDYPNLNPQLALISDGTVQRFEVYWNGIELVNGYSELLDADECRRRFEYNNNQRAEQGMPTMPLDEAFLTMLEQGMPQCAGASLGVDRLLMLLADESDIAETLAFAWNNA